MLNPRLPSREGGRIVQAVPVTTARSCGRPSNKYEFHDATLKHHLDTTPSKETIR